jgi:hypothetical protein
VHFDHANQIFNSDSEAALARIIIEIVEKQVGTLLVVKDLDAATITAVSPVQHSRTAPYR